MVKEKTTGKSAVDDYFSALLLDTQVVSENESAAEPVLRFARVNSGFELAEVWRGTLTPAQQLCCDLTVLSLLQNVTGIRLKQVMLNSIKRVGC